MELVVAGGFDVVFAGGLRRTDLHKLSAARGCVSTRANTVRKQTVTNLGEKVVREKEYRSAMLRPGM